MLVTMGCATGSVSANGRDRCGCGHCVVCGDLAPLRLAVALSLTDTTESADARCPVPGLALAIGDEFASARAIGIFGVRPNV